MSEFEQVISSCPRCKAETESHRNWALVGKGQKKLNVKHARIYLFLCDSCGLRWRQTKLFVYEKG